MTDKTSMKLKGILLASVFACGALAAPQVAADDVEMSANVSFVSDYRFRGVSLSDKDMAIQGGLDFGMGGFYAGTWGSSIDTFGGSEFELDLYGGYAGEVEGISYDVGLLLYAYPGSDNEYLEVYGSVGGAVESVEWSLGAAYAFSEKDTGNQDNIYVYLDASMPVSDTGLSVAGHVGLEDGAFGDNKIDWLLGLNYDYEQFSFGVSYVDTDTAGRLTKGGVVVSVGASF